MAHGNLLSDGSRSLVWNGANQLSSFIRDNATVALTYGPDGTRAIKSWPFGKTLYPSADIEIDANTPGSEVFTYYPHPDIKITATAGGITGRYVLLRDHLASIRRVTDANGNVAEETSYAAYGELTNTSMQTQKSYIGERFDPQTGLTYLNARSYDPAFGRYVPPDEAGDQAGQARPKQVGHP